MALWKPFLGTRAALDTVEKHPGYVYWCADDGSLHFDYTDADGVLQRKQINAKDAETLCGMSLDELKNEFTTQDAVILREAQIYTDQTIEAAKVDAITQDAVILHESQAYTDTKILAVMEQVQTKADAQHTHTTLNLENLLIGGIDITQFIENIVQKMMDAGRIIDTQGGDTNE